MGSRGLRTRFASRLLFASFGLLLFGGGLSPGGNGATVFGQGKNPSSGGGTLQLDNPALPDTDLVEQPHFDFFAWNSFIALSWPALDPDTNNGQRGFPNVKGTSFVDAKCDDLAVWETYKEKREVFNHPKVKPGPGSWNGALNYGTLRSASEFPELPPASGRVLHASAKFNTFDETVQVASEALEKTLGNGQPNPIHGRPVAPRVWRGTPASDNAIVYEVKVNYDFFNYVTDHEFYVADVAEEKNVNTDTAAAKGEIALPYRTSAASGPRGQKPSSGHETVVGYSSKTVADTFKKVQPTGNQVPPLTGAVHLKAAWIRLTPQEVKSGKYHVAEANYYVTEKDSTGEYVPVAKSDSFGLVGLHIIQRIHTGAASDEEANLEGGTFVFATFEHVGNDTAGFTYANFYSAPPLPNTPKQGFYPDVFNQQGKGKQAPYDVKRRYQPITNPHRKDPTALGTKEVNDFVHAAIRARNPNSVWLNYRLIGTQFRAISVTDRPVGKPRYAVNQYDPTGIGQPAYLANLVIETNDGLQFFQGLPPTQFPPVIPKYVGAGIANNPSDSAFARDFHNTAFGRSPFNMGGCMGCHGVAQTKGYSFSFVLLGGYKGAATDSQSDFEVPGGSVPEGN